MEYEFVPFSFEDQDEKYMFANEKECAEEMEFLLATCDFIVVENTMYPSSDFKGVGMGLRGPTLLYNTGLYDWWYRLRGGYELTSKN